MKNIIPLASMLFLISIILLFGILNFIEPTLLFGEVGYANGAKLCIQLFSLFTIGWSINTFVNFIKKKYDLVLTNLKSIFFLLLFLPMVCGLNVGFFDRFYFSTGYTIIGFIGFYLSVVLAPYILLFIYLKKHESK